MQNVTRQTLPRLVICLLVAAVLCPAVLAQTHVVGPADMQKQIISASQAREQKIDTVTKFLSSPAAEKAMKSARMNPVEVKTAVSTLSDAELTQLASRADKAQADFAAGSLSDRDLLLIILGIAALVLIIVAVR